MVPVTSGTKQNGYTPVKLGDSPSKLRGKNLALPPPVCYTGGMIPERIERLRQRGETSIAKRAFLDYLAMGPKRSLRKLVAQYRNPELYDQDQEGNNPPPTRQINTIQAWSSAYRWQDRLKEVQDDQIDTILREQRRAMAEAMKVKYARPENRIEALNEIAEMIMEYLVGNQLVQTVFKQVGSGKNVKIVEEAKVDVPAINALRGILQDLASETGGRPKNVTHRLPDGPMVENQTIFVLPEVEPIEVVDVTPRKVMKEITSGDNGSGD